VYWGGRGVIRAVCGGRYRCGCNRSGGNEAEGIGRKPGLQHSPRRLKLDICGDISVDSWLTAGWNNGEQRHESVSRRIPCNLPFVQHVFRVMPRVVAKEAICTVCQSFFPLSARAE